MKFNHTAHKALWKWLADNPYMEKADWPGWEENGGSIDYDVENDCFACEYARNQSTEVDYCDNCPLIWPDGSCMNGGLFERWSGAFRPSEYRTAIARQIANLPVKPGVECE